MLTMRLLIVVTFVGGLLYGEDITLPLDDGSIAIRAQFIRPSGFGSDVPELSIEIKNHTSSSWRTLKLRFDIGGLCKGEPRQWTVPVTTSLGRAEDHPMVKEYVDTVIPLVGTVDGCKTEIIKASLVLAESSTARIDGVAGARVDLEKQLLEIKAKREAEAAARVEEEKTAAAAQAKKDAVEAARQKRLASERKQKQAEADAKAAEARRRIRAV